MNVTTPDLKHHSHSRSLSHSLTATTEFKHLTASPTKTTKGKQREQDTWQFDWWDYVPLLEGNKPSVINRKFAKCVVMHVLTFRNCWYTDLLSGQVLR